MEEIYKAIKKVNIFTKQELLKIEQLFNAYSTDRKRNRISINSIGIDRSLNSLYEGFHCNFSDKNRFTIVCGPAYSGKSTSFFKLEHFFSEFTKQKCPVKNTSTTLSIKFMDTKNKRYTIKFDSTKRHLDEKFKVIQINEVGTKISEIEDPITLLTQCGIISNPINDAFFIPQIKDIATSFVSKFCSTKEGLRLLYRNPYITQVITQIKTKEKEIEDRKKKLLNEEKGIDDRIDIQKLNIKRRVSQINKRQKLIEKQDYLIKLWKILEKSLIKASNSNKDLKKKIGGLRRRLKSLSNEIEEIEQRLEFGWTSSIDKFVTQRTFICRICGKQQPIGYVVKHVKNGTCWCCGNMNYDYSAQLS